MLKKTIKYEDYNGVERNEDFYFNLTKAELFQMELGFDGGLEEYIMKIIKAQDVKTIIDLFKKLILQSYGEKSDDGKRFIKINDEGVNLANRFAQTEAFSQLYMELATDDNAASEFIKGIIPKGIEVPNEKINEKAKELGIEIPKSDTK